MADVKTQPVEDLIRSCEPICRKVVSDVVSQCFLTHEDGEDLMQTARMAVVEAQRKYEARNGAEFSTFVWVVVRSRVKNAAKGIKRHRGLAEDEDGLIYEPVAVGAEDEPVKEATRGEIEALLALLPEDDQKPLRLLLEGKSYSEIARDLALAGKNPRGMALHRIRKVVDKLWERMLAQKYPEPVAQVGV